jgi:hypothetical protein
MTRRWANAHGRRFEVETLDSVVTPAPAPKRKRKHGPFTKVPTAWEEELGKAHVSGGTYAVAIVLLYEAWWLVSRGQPPVVKLTTTMLKRVRVGRDGKGAALLKLAELRLVSVEQSPGRNPLVTVYFLD